MHHRPSSGRICRRCHTALLAGCTPRFSCSFLKGSELAIEVAVNGCRDIYFSGVDPESEYRSGEWTLKGEVAVLRLDEQGRLPSRFDLPFLQ